VSAAVSAAVSVAAVVAVSFVFVKSASVVELAANAVVDLVLISSDAADVSMELVSESMIGVVVLRGLIGLQPDLDIVLPLIMGLSLIVVHPFAVLVFVVLPEPTFLEAFVQLNCFAWSSG
jgi:hypothetical protein